MPKRILKWLFYLLYIAAGAIISHFLPENSRYILGVAITFLARWSWRVTTDKPIFIGCNCDPESRRGTTSVMCCNLCGKPDEEFWTGKKTKEVIHE
jgi:hypothetical protein